MKNKNSFIWGVILIFLGLLFIASSIFKFNIFFDGWWTLFIIVPSLIAIFTTKDKFSSALVLLIGILLFASCRGFMDIGSVVIISIGLAIIATGVNLVATERNKRKNKGQKTKNENNKTQAGILGMSEVKITNEYTGGNLTAVLGGVTLDLREAKIKKDITINVTAIMGGIDIKVKDDVNVVLNTVNILGASESKLKPKKESKVTIYIEGMCFLGGTEIK